jgi:hypothetical protein
MQARPGRSGSITPRICGSVSSGVGFDLGSAPEGVAGWLYPHQEEVSMQSSCFTKGLLIAENAG